MENKFYAIVVSYNPDVSRLSENVKNLTRQGFLVVLIDNNSSNKDEIREKIECYKIIYLESNQGIAKALNIGMDYSVNDGADWILSSDQDTVISSEILNEYKKYLSLKDVGALCPMVKRKDGYHSINSNDSEYDVVERCPTSGFFISAKAWNDGCRYDDWMFIDYVDYDICIQLNIKGYKIYRIKKAEIIQNLGESFVIKPIEGIGKLFRCKKIINFSHTYNHSAFRNYYFVRNSLFYQYKYRKYINIGKERSFLLKWEIKKLLLEKHRIANIKSIVRGIKDYRKHIKFNSN